MFTHKLPLRKLFIPQNARWKASDIKPPQSPGAQSTKGSEPSPTTDSEAAGGDDGWIDAIGREAADQWVSCEKNVNEAFEEAVSDEDVEVHVNNDGNIRAESNRGPRGLDRTYKKVSKGVATVFGSKEARWERASKEVMAGRLTPELNSPVDEKDESLLQDGQAWVADGVRERQVYSDGNAGDDVDVYVNADKSIPAEPPNRLEILPRGLDRAVQRTALGVNSAVHRTADSVNKTWEAATKAPAFAQDTLTGAISAGLSAVKQTELNNVSVMTPVGVLLAAAGGASANVTRAMVREAKGGKDTSVKLVVAQAEAHFNAGMGHWTKPQEDLFKELLEEVESGLEAFGNNDYVGSDESTETKENVTNTKVGDYWRVADDTMLRQNPTRSLLRAKAPELYCVVIALEELTKMPWQVKKVSAEQILANLEDYERRGNFIGAQKHKESLTDVAIDSSRNAVAGAREQVKYLPVAIEGPGTGKSSCAETMMKASGQHYIKISGEMIKSWTVPKEDAAKAALATAAKASHSEEEKSDEKSTNKKSTTKKSSAPSTPETAEYQKDICDVLMDEVKRQLRKLDSTNVWVLLDDLHMAYDTSMAVSADGKEAMKGPFARDPHAFTKLMDVFKTCTDASQDRVPGDEVELSPLPGKRSIKFPVSFKRVTFYITGNVEHDAFTANPKKPGSEWLTSRLKRMGTSYMTPADRMRTATHDWRGKTNHIIAQHYHKRSAQGAQSEWGYFPVDEKGDRIKDQEVANLDRVEREIDQDLAKQSLGSIAQYDIDIATSDYAGENGHRGLIYFLTNFDGFITRQLSKSVEINRKIFDITDFDFATATKSISDYTKARNAQLAEKKGQEEIDRALQALRHATSNLKGAHQDYVNNQLAKAVSEPDMSEKKAAIRATQDLLTWYGQRVKPPTIRQLLSRIEEELKHTKADELSDDVDRYRPTKNFIVSLHTRKKMTDEGEYGKSKNKIVRVRLTHPTAYDQGFFEKLGLMLGGVPVHFLDSDSFLSSPTPLPSFNRDDFTRDTKSKELYDKALEDALENTHIMTHNDNRYRIELKELKRAKRSYFYATLRPGRENVYFIFDPQHIEGVLGGRDILPNTGAYKLIKSPKMIGEIIDEYELPRLSFVDEYVRNAVKAPSMGEPYLVALLTGEVQERIMAWASVRSNGAPLEPNVAIKRFQEYISNEVLNQERVRAHGKDIDPRAMTLFLVDGPGEPHNPVANDDDKIVSTVTLAPPTLDGRGARADSAIKRTLAQVIREAYWKTEEVNLPKPVLTPEEQRARDALVAYDRNVAAQVRDEKKVILTTTFLEKAAVDLAKLIGERFTLDGAEREGVYLAPAENVEVQDGEVFPGYDGLPSVRNLEKGWQAEYGAEIARIDAEIAARKTAEERAERERRAAEERKRRPHYMGVGGYDADFATLAALEGLSVLDADMTPDASSRASSGGGMGTPPTPGSKGSSNS